MNPEEINFNAYKANNLHAIIDLFQNDPSISSNTLQDITAALSAKTPQEFFYLKKSIDFLISKNSLRQTIFDFLLETPKIESCFKLFKFLGKITTYDREITDTIIEISEVFDPATTIDRLSEFQDTGILNNEISFDFFDAVLTLITIGMDQENYISAIKQASAPSLLADAFKILKENDLLANEYLNFIIQEVPTRADSPLDKAEILARLKKYNLLSEINFKLCKKNKRLFAFNFLTEMLETKPEILKNNFTFLVTKNANRLVLYVNFLIERRLLRENYIEIIKYFTEENLNMFSYIMLNSENFISQTNIIALSYFKGTRLKKIANAISLLKTENFFTRDNFDLLFSNSFTPDVVYEFANALIVLKNHELNDLYLKLAIHSYEQPLLLAFSIRELAGAAILSYSNVDKIKNSKSIHLLLRLLRKLRQNNFLTEENFLQLIRLDEFLVDISRYKTISRLKNIHMNFFKDLFLLLDRGDLSTENKLIKIDELMASKSYLKIPSLPINRAQSTHLTSIHRSLSESAKKFFIKYAETISNDELDRQFNTIVLELERELSTCLTNRQYIQSAINALKGIISQADFVEPQSGLSLKTLFFSLWQGIHDESERIGNLVDAKNQLIEGLYEIQRGGNIDAYGHDNGLADEPICCLGAFNKLLEKLLGVHSFVNLVIINYELALIKFPIIVNEEIEYYLLNDGFDNFLSNYDTLKEEGVAVIWQNIEAKVKEKLLDEFSSIYTDSRTGETNSQFAALLESHAYLEIDDALLANLKSSYALRKLEQLATARVCGETSGFSGRKSRSATCSEEANGKNSYSPFKSYDRRMQYLLSFLIGKIKKINTCNYLKK
ncbi:uncharacterized protein RVIR1_09090 [Candidatus Rickettsiella viridis]|uniref:Uncharacterized protein n=1 Tax=Candidatus Rickettsiella viridis TaxID=676208 RepID=A0A2Z5UUZ6_9COXI|nr:hypothetical protein [Candidatus Rickettsiella viridis]BBB15389.1 uncharacterized protein RVIR1_09090 [Candidatus Rickettsiella viridis]